MAMAQMIATTTRNHDGSDGGPDHAPPGAIGAIRSASMTHLPRGSLSKQIAVVSGPFFSIALGGGYLARTTTYGIVLALSIAAVGVLAAAAVVVHYVINSGPVATWVGDDGVAIGARRVMSRALVVRFSDVADADLITSHFYDPADAGKSEPRWLALLFRFQARGAGRKVLMSVEGRADYREPGRPDDDDPETLRHVSKHHAWWFATAAEKAWRARTPT